jgi:8-oxo-dGTP pyrophosphatase MutT (NUDIX family)
VNDRGEIMVSRRSDGVFTNQGKWQSYFGGHVEPGKSFEETAQQELEEEAGIRVALSDLHWITSRRNEKKKLFSERYAVMFNGKPSDLRFTDGEVTEARWMPMREQWTAFLAHPDVWCNGCSPEEQEKIAMLQ